MVFDIRRALVSLWSHGHDDSKASFLCSGVFIGPRVVLTVKHVFEGRSQGDVWVRPQVNRSPALAIDETVRFHPRLDAAIVRIASAPPDARHIELDRHESHRRGDVYRLSGYWQGDPQVELKREVTNWVEAKAWYATTPVHAKGMSGGSLCIDGRLWGLMTEHYVDALIDRGCSVAMHQLWDGFLDGIEGLGTSAPEPRVSPQPAALRVQLRNDFTQQIKQLFGRAPLASWAWADPLVEGIPHAVARVLASDDRQLGEQLVSLLSNLVDDLVQSLNDCEIELKGPDPDRVKRLLMHSMGLAARLCIAPEEAEIYAAARGRLDVAASTVEGAMVAVSKRPELGWEASRDPAAPYVKDRRAMSGGLEFGEGDDQRYGLASLIASMPSKDQNPTGEQRRVRTMEQLSWLRGYLNNERDKHRGRCLVLMPQQELAADMVEWLDDLGVRVLVLRSDQPSAFWFDEGLLLGKIQGFLHAIAAHAVWKNT